MLMLLGDGCCLLLCYELHGSRKMKSKAGQGPLTISRSFFVSRKPYRCLKACSMPWSLSFTSRNTPYLHTNLSDLCLGKKKRSRVAFRLGLLKSSIALLLSSVNGAQIVRFSAPVPCD